MPLQIQRPVSVYRLWDDGDLKAVFVDHFEAGWLATLTYVADGGAPGFRLAMQNSATRQAITASLSDVVVSDLVTVLAQTVEQYNAANPNNAISGEGS